MDEPVPVTILSGTLGAGKTVLLNHVLTSEHEYDVAVVVNDMGEVNVDADLITRRVDGEDVVELSNGCICCGMQGDLEQAITDLALNEDFGYLLVEPSGISEPKPVGQQFVQGRAAGFYTLDSVTTVVNAREFSDAFGDGTAERKGKPGETRPLSDLIVDGVEFCDTLIINKADLVSDTELEAIQETLRALQPSAEMYVTEFGKIHPSELLGTGRFDVETVDSAASWKQALDNHRTDDEAARSRADHDDHRHPPDVYDVESFMYQHRRPMHPERLAETLANFPDSVIRAKGLLHIGGRPEYALNLSVAGEQAYVDVSGRWIASLSETRQESYRQSRNPEWNDTWGDRKTQLVIIGREMDTEAIEDALDRCLCVEDELNEESAENPFPQREGEELRL